VLLVGFNDSWSLILSGVLSVTAFRSFVEVIPPRSMWDTRAVVL
jgi:hypothetical protein